MYLSLSLSIYIYIYTSMHACICVYIYENIYKYLVRCYLKKVNQPFKNLFIFITKALF